MFQGGRETFSLSIGGRKEEEERGELLAHDEI